MDKRYNDYLDNSNNKPKMPQKRMYTRQNSNKLIETLNSTQRNFSNKKLFLSNSYQKRDIISKTNETIKNVMAEKIQYKRKKETESGVKLVVDNQQPIPLIESGMIILVESNNIVIEQMTNTKYYF